MKKLLYSLALVASILGSLTSCHNDETPTPWQFFPANRPNDFSFETTTTTDISLQYPRQAAISLYTDDPTRVTNLGTLLPFLTGYTTAGGSLEMRVTIPDATVCIYATTDTEGCPRLMCSKRDANGKFLPFEVIGTERGTQPLGNQDTHLATLYLGGIVGFEDNYPNAGDWDMNDVMMSYLRTIRIRDWQEVENITDEWAMVADGAGYSNAFGYELFGEISLPDSTRCTISRRDVNVSIDISHSYGGTFECHGLDNDLSVPTVMLFDDINHVPNDNTTWQVTTTFRRRVSYSELIRLNHIMNPFIVAPTFGTANIGETSLPPYLHYGRNEVHPAYYAPTEKFNISLFGRGDDKSDMSQGIYFVRNQLQPYPFAIHIMGNSYIQSNGDIIVIPDFVVPAETVIMSQTYPSFGSWYNSKGSTDKEWFRAENVINSGSNKLRRRVPIRGHKL
ncbi:MAG: LruC domain-containing protein [Bacteroidaceae bacterium]|nr:LruC domain-containing protein [Bacteroidaceae bacterium]